MVLQYTNKKTNEVIYEDAESIKHCVVHVLAPIEQFNAIQLERAKELEEKGETAKEPVSLEPLYVKIHEHIVQFVRCGEMTFLLGETEINQLTSVQVVTLLSRGVTPRTYVFNNAPDALLSVYLLNDTGKTLARIV